jgi:hypothetical protein
LSDYFIGSGTMWDRWDAMRLRDDFDNHKYHRLREQLGLLDDSWRGLPMTYGAS